MIWLAAVGGGTFVLVSLVLGPRLLAMARRTGGIPEFTMGLGLLLMGGLGYPLATLGRVVTAFPEDVRGFLVGCSALCNTMGFAAVLVFTWRVFRPASLVAEALVGLALVCLALLLPAEAVWPGLVPSALSIEPYPGLPGNLRVVLGLAIIYWAGFEAAWYTRMLRRRLALGLADPVVADRVKLWAIAIGGASVSYTTAFVLALMGIDLPAAPFGAAVIGGLGLVSATSAWLAFLAPEAYLRRVRARAEQVPLAA
jgi:hypothetical protein